MRRAHSSRRAVRFSRRCATSSRSSAALVSALPAPSPTGGMSDSAIVLLLVRAVRGAGKHARRAGFKLTRAEGEDRDVVARLARGGGEHRLLDALGDRIGIQPRARAQDVDELAIAEDLL